MAPTFKSEFCKIEHSMFHIAKESSDFQKKNFQCERGLTESLEKVTETAK